jgi:glycosyltransferase involved in cell wall biosynthesis
MSRLVRAERPDICHLHNIYHQISPSILHILKAAGVPMIMTLHDLKMVCPAYLLARDGTLCRACSHRHFYRCAQYACIKGSRAKSLLVSAEMYLHHVFLRVYNLVDVCICPSLFLKERLMDMGFRGKLVHLPNFIIPNEFVPCYGGRERSVAYFGRLSREKGVVTLLEAMRLVPGVTLKIIGEGPLRKELEAKAAGNPNIRFLGYMSGDALKDEVSSSMCVAYPSECHENNPRGIIEAFALGKPVVASDIGGIPELVKDGKTGYLFPAGNSGALAACLRRVDSDREKLRQMGGLCRELAEQEFSDERHYARLMRLYEDAGKEQGAKRERSDGTAIGGVRGRGVDTAGGMRARGN